MTDSAADFPLLGETSCGDGAGRGDRSVMGSVGGDSPYAQVRLRPWQILPAVQLQAAAALVHLDILYPVLTSSCQ